MADNNEQQKPGVSKWTFAAILLVLALFMGLSVAYKIITKGP